MSPHDDGPGLLSERTRDLLPDHPFIHAQDKFEGFFGNASPVILALIVEEGTIFSPTSTGPAKLLNGGRPGPPRAPRAGSDATPG